MSDLKTDLTLGVRVGGVAGLVGGGATMRRATGATTPTATKTNRPAPGHTTALGGRVHRGVKTGIASLLQLEMLLETKQLRIQLTWCDGLEMSDDGGIHWSCSLQGQ
jgi:hypothetical protein